MDALPVTMMTAVVDDMGVVALFVNYKDAMTYLENDRKGARLCPAVIQGWTTWDARRGDARRLG